MVLSLAFSNNWSLKQLDVHNAFLNDELDEIVYMKQLHDFENSTNPYLVRKLTKALYGLKLAPRIWFNKLSESLKDLGFTKSKVDPFMFFFHNKNILTIVLAYVDDIIIMGSNSNYITLLIQALHSKFHLKDLVKLQLLVGIEASKSVDSIRLS